jgi:acyl-CoA synthetase (NDP forming)
MNALARLLDPHSIAIVGLSSDERKHGGRVLGHLRRLGYPGEIWGVNPGLPDVDGVAIYPSVRDLPGPPDLVVAAVPAPAAVDVVAQSAGVGAVVVFAAGFAEAGPEGAALQEDLAAAAGSAETRVLGPNSGGVIRPRRRVAASFLTCLERPPEQIRSGPVGVVTQSGGTGSFIHNLAAGRGEGLSVSVATGNEADIRLGEAVDAVSRLGEVEVVVAIIETLRDGTAFIEAVRNAQRRGRRVVACHLGTGTLGASLLTSHTGAMALSPAILSGVFDSLGVVIADTPAEAYEVATLLARAKAPKGPGAGIVTHSGGAAILLADLAERAALDLPSPSRDLQAQVEPLLDHGTADNPLDMGAIIGGPSRFAEVVALLAQEFDVLMAVSTPHPPAHTDERVASLLALDAEPPLIHLWMAGDQAAHGLRTLRERGAAVTEDPRAAIRALAALARGEAAVPETVEPLTGPVESWGLPLEIGILAATVDQALEAAEDLGYPVVLKAEAPGLAHRTDLEAVRVDLRGPEEVERAFTDVLGAVAAAGWTEATSRLQRYRPGLEMIVAAVRHPSLGPLVSVGIGGVLAEVIDDVVFAPGPVDASMARGLIDRLRSRALLDGYRRSPPADVGELADIVSVVSRGLGDLREVEINPLIWDGRQWVGADWLIVA